MPSAERPTSTNQQRSESVTPQEWYSAADLYDDTTTATPAPIPRQEKVLETMAPPPQAMAPAQAKDERSAPSLTMLSAYGEPEPPSQFRWWHGAILGLFILLFVGGAVSGWYWWSHRGTELKSNPQADSTVPASPSPSTADSATSTSASEQTSASRSADEEIKRLREQRRAAKPSDRGSIIAAFKDAEKKYQNDYRFPYERAKLSVEGITTHHEAFGALAIAADKAIDSGKAQEVLDSLVADKDGDFYKLSRGHHEWQALVQALSSKDKRGVSELRH